MNDWNIQSRAHACQACGKGFVDKEVYHTLLLAQRSELQRLDICQGCWDAEQGKPNGGSSERKGFVSHWHGHYQKPSPPPPEAIQKENAETLLRKLIEANDPKHGPACYILAVMLERKRQLRIKEQFKREGVRVFVYEQPKTGDIFTITDPDLQLNQLDEVQRDVTQLLAHGLPQSAPTPPAPLPAEAPPVAPEAATNPPAAPAAASATESPAPSSAGPAPDTGVQTQDAASSSSHENGNSTATISESLPTT